MRLFLSMNTHLGVDQDLGTMCLSESVATLDRTLAFKDEVHIHLPTWTENASQLPHSVLRHRNSDPSQDWRKRCKAICWPPIELSRVIMTTRNFHCVSSCTQKRKRPIREITSPPSNFFLISTHP